MTLDEISRLPRNYITPLEAAKVLGADPQAIRIAARDNPDGLGFPVILIQHRIKIPKAPFLAYMGWDGGENNDTNGRFAED